MAKAPPTPRRKMRFEPAFALVARRVQQAGESRGFAVARLLTDWADVVGPQMAARTRPVKITHGRDFGATLVLLTTGPQAPLVEMELPRIREKVNACYGYNAIARIRLTQTAPTGFAEGQAVFTHATQAPAPPAPEAVSQARQCAQGITDPDLRAALEKLALNRLAPRQGTNPRKVF